MCNENTYFQTISQYLVDKYTFLFLNERDKLIVIEQTQFLISLFLCSEFKLKDIYSGVKFCRKNVCGNFYCGNLFCGSLEKSQKSQNSEPAKISCHTVK